MPEDNFIINTSEHTYELNTELAACKITDSCHISKKECSELGAAMD